VLDVWSRFIGRRQFPAVCAAPVFPAAEHFCLARARDCIP
jgi:hypothetical protein